MSLKPGGGTFYCTAETAAGTFYCTAETAAGTFYYIVETDDATVEVPPFFCYFFSSSGGRGKIQLKLTTLPRIFIHVVCRFITQ